MAVQKKSDQFAVRDKQHLFYSTRAGHEGNSLIHSYSNFMWTACEGYGRQGHGKPLELGSHWNWETRIMTFGYPNLVLVSLFAIEFSVNSGKHSTRTLGLVQNWVRFFF